MPEATGKICIRCGQDCSNKQRAKDAQGNYICADCLSKAKARQPAPPPIPGAKSPSAKPPVVASPKSEIVHGDQNVLGKLIDESVEMHKHGCPNCHAPMKPTQVLCVKCGFNKERGKQLQTVVKTAVQEKGVDDSALRRRKRSFISNLGPGIALAIAGFAILCLGGAYLIALNGGEDQKIVFFAAHGLFGFLTFIFVVVAAFMDSVGKGFGILLAWIVSGVGGLGILPFGKFLSLGLIVYIAYWIYAESESILLQALFSVYIVSTIAFVAMALQLATS